MKTRSRRNLVSLLRIVLWQLPEEPYPSDHPTALRRAPREVRA